MPHSADTGNRTIPQDSPWPLPPPSDAIPAGDSVAILSGKRLWRRWFALVTVGELLGFLTPSVVGALVVDRVDLLAAGALLVAGAVEGATLGWFQARALRPALPGLRSSRWIIATVLGALVAWSVGALFVVTDGLSGWARGAQVAGFGVGGLVILLSIGVAQWAVLRAHTDRAARWISANALAWLAGLTVFTAFTSPLWQPGQAAAVVAVIGVFGGLLMAAVMAAVTGLFLVGLVEKSRR
ncbi:hypothetical protein [Nocardia shimofusensis]|uniref:hypothetical protein n=1 Tax=Nocardia shimofusensis TaxID=228596 RepID=UPI000B03E7FD|nr:hypothetical protein [Nocardia shimofusensis]